ncbi:hypothetical protein [Priestia megaterium]|uniref:hypothetical protein n=1 Tax=Priestia megaterium TaxID=1404 RepID=UPI001865CE8E|nr:hypothetical protein [Priestia megaterium]MBE2978464.1 hypothetical protein [Priestia megaterium]
MDMLLRDIDPIAVKKIDEIAKEKKISRQDFLKDRSKRREFLREIKNDVKREKEKS